MKSEIRNKFSLKRLRWMIGMGCLAFCAVVAQSQLPPPPALPGPGGAPTGAPPQAPAPNLIRDGGFEKPVPFLNIYDGIDGSGNVRVQGGGGPVFLEGSNFDIHRPLPFAASVCVADVNGDRVPDLVVASPRGSLFWYPNCGTKTEPAFKQAELVQTSLGQCPRINVADWNGDGKLDVIFGNIWGEIHVMINQGTSSEPRWVKETEMGKPRWFPPRGADDIPVQEGYSVINVQSTQKEPLTVGNYSAPVYADWNKDGSPDLVVGEGSYSANSIHIWLNSGGRMTPAFKHPASKFYVAFGEGREQLTPSVYDWNGDGIQDVLVGDRNGQVALYLGTAEAIKDFKKVEPVEFTKFVTLGGKSKLGSLISICACDLNGDGIADLVYGTTGGIINAAYGSGKREDPELTTSMPLRGVDLLKDFKQASWTPDGVPAGKGPIPEVVSKEDDPNAVIKEGKYAYHFRWFEKFYGWVWSGNRWEDTGHHGEQTSIGRFVMGRQYEVSFWCKGQNMKMGYGIHYRQHIHNEASKKNEGPLSIIDHHYGEGVNLGSDWQFYRKTHRLLGHKNQEVDTNGQTNAGWFNLSFHGRGEAWVDGCQLIEVGK